jgi:hypothetical protein
VLCLMAVVAAGLPSPSAGQEDSSRVLLEGVKSVHVQVDRRIGGGMDGNQLQGGIEQQLRDAGVTVLSAEEYGKFRMSKGYPFARLDVTANSEEVKTGAGSFSVTQIAVVARQKVMLDRNARVKIMAETWERRMAAIDAGPETIRQQIFQWVDEFISDLNAANP